ncbi:hypothetical protein PTKIN_Ptkin10aG0050200 [Pterospermum kingtungense]
MAKLLMSRPFNKDAMIRTFKVVWRLSKNFDVSCLDANLFLFNFANLKDKKRVLEGWGQGYANSLRLTWIQGDWVGVDFFYVECYGEVNVANKHIGLKEWIPNVDLSTINKEVLRGNGANILDRDVELSRNSCEFVPCTLSISKDVHNQASPILLHGNNRLHENDVGDVLPTVHEDHLKEPSLQLMKLGSLVKVVSLVDVPVSVAENPNYVILVAKGKKKVKILKRADRKGINDRSHLLSKKMLVDKDSEVENRKRSRVVYCNDDVDMTPHEVETGEDQSHRAL